MNPNLPVGPTDAGGLPRDGRDDVWRPRPEADETDVVDLRDIWAVLRRRRATILATTLGLVTVAIVYTLWVTPVWHARTLIRVDEEQHGDLISPAVTALTGLQGGGSQIETELSMLRTRPIAEDVVDRHDLNLVVTEPRDVPRQLLFARLELGRDTREGTYEVRPAADGRYRVRTTGGAAPPLDVVVAPGEAVDLPDGVLVLADLAGGTDGEGDPLPVTIEFETLPFQEAVEDFTETMTAGRPDLDANILQIGYRTTDRVLVHEVPNTHAESFIARRIEAKKADARSTEGFLEEQVEDTRRQLLDVEAQLRDFSQGEQIVALGAEAEATVGRLATLETQRTQLEAERSSLAGLLSDIDAEGGRPDYRRLASFPTFFRNDAVTGMLSSLIQADSARDALLTRMTESHPDVVAVEGRIEQLEAQLGAIGRNYLGSLSDQIAALDTVLSGFGSDLAQVPERQIEFARIQRQVDMLAELYAVLQTRLKEAQVNAAIDDSSVRIVEYAIEPLDPESPRPVRNLALAIALGLLLGIVLAFVREYMDRRLHSTDRIEALFGLPTMARIPGSALRNGRTGAGGALVALDDTRSVAAESFRNLRTNVAFLEREGSAREFVVASPSSGEGTSLTAANLAVTLAQKGRSTLLVDGDMRRPAQHDLFDVPRAPGLSDWLLADGMVDGAIRPTSLEALHFLPAGGQAPNPAELLDSPRMDRLLAAVRESYEIVVFDAPPILAVTDAAVLAARSGGVILVVRAEKTEKDAIELAIRQLRQVNAAILGMVVNDADTRRQAYYEQYSGEDAPSGLRALLQRLQGVFS